MTAPTDARLVCRDLSLSYGGPDVVRGVTLEVPDGRITTLVGANGCGKSTLLRGLVRLLRPTSGQVLLDGDDLHRIPTRQVATTIGLLPQQPLVPAGLTVAELVSRGRHPHRAAWRPASRADHAAVAEAIAPDADHSALAAAAQAPGADPAPASEPPVTLLADDVRLVHVDVDPAELTAEVVRDRSPPSASTVTPPAPSRTSAPCGTHRPRHPRPTRDDDDDGSRCPALSRRHAWPAHRERDEPGPRDLRRRGRLRRLCQSRRRTLTSAEWSVTADVDRVGARLQGPTLERAVTDELPSEEVVRGSCDRAAQLVPGARVRLSRAGAPARRRAPR